MSSPTTSETAIFERIVLPSQPGLHEEAARSILAMQFSPEDRQRMQLLADKAKSGALSPDDEQEVGTGQRRSLLGNPAIEGRHLPIKDCDGRVPLKWHGTDAPLAV